MSVTLIYGARMVESCDTAWTVNANVTTPTPPEPTIKKEGAASAKLIIADAFGTGVAAYKAITSTTMEYATQIRFWIRSSIACNANDLQFLIDNTAACSSPLETLNIGALTADTWSQQTLTLGTPANLTAVISIGLNVAIDKGAQNVYIDKIELVSESRTFTGELHVIGFDNPEGQERFPDPNLVKLLDGSWHETKAVTVTRNITIDMGVKTNSELYWLADWWNAETRSITYAGETIAVVVEGDFPVERRGGIALAKNLTIQCKEKTGRLIYQRPSSWT